MPYIYIITCLGKNVLFKYEIMSVPIGFIHFTRHLISTYCKYEQSTLKSGNSVKLQMREYCWPKFFFFLLLFFPPPNTNDSFMQSGPALWMKKAPSVVNSCNSKNITVSTWEAPFTKGLVSQKQHVNMNGTIIFIHTMIRLFAQGWLHIVHLTNATLVANGKPLTWISLVNCYYFKVSWSKWCYADVSIPHHSKTNFSTFLFLNERFVEKQSISEQALCSCL